MDQCSRHDIPPAVRGDLTDQQGHNLELELEALATVVLTCWWLGDQLHTRRERGGRSPLGLGDAGTTTVLVRIVVAFVVGSAIPATARMLPSTANPDRGTARRGRHRVRGDTP